MYVRTRVDRWLAKQSTRDTPLEGAPAINGVFPSASRIPLVFPAVQKVTNQELIESQPRLGRDLVPPFVL